jgi:hypothetical protein
MNYTGRVDLSKATKEDLLAIMELIPKHWLLRDFREAMERELHRMREERLLKRMNEICELTKTANREERLMLHNEFTVVNNKLSKLQGV